MGREQRLFFPSSPARRLFLSPQASAEVMAQGTIKRATNTYNLFCNMMLQNEWVESNVGRFTTHVLQTCLATNQVAASHQKIELWSSSCSGTPVNVVTNGPKKFGRDNELTLLTSVSLQENVWLFLPGDQKKVAVITRRPYYRGSCKAGFHCISNGAFCVWLSALNGMNLDLQIPCDIAPFSADPDPAIRRGGRRAGQTLR